MARQGKIARLPFRLRKEVNERLHDGQKSSAILIWLNGEKEAKRVWELDFEGVPASAQNISEWRLGGFKDWLCERSRLDNVEALTDFALQVAQRSGSDLADGAAAILAGQIVSSLEQIADADSEGGGMSLEKVAFAVAALREGDLGKQKLKLAQDKHILATERAKLDREKFERQTCEAVLKAAKSKEIQEILGSGKSKSVQLDLLHDQLFGKAPAK